MNPDEKLKKIESLTETYERFLKALDDEAKEGYHRGLEEILVKLNLILGEQ